MATKFYIDSNNKYLGGFDGDTGKVPVGAIEVPMAPLDARSDWNGSTWNNPVLTVPEKEINLGVTLEARIEALFKLAAYGDSTLLDEIKIKIDQAKV